MEDRDCGFDVVASEVDSPGRIGPPKVAGETGVPCPECKCPQTYSIEVQIQNVLLKGGTGTGIYLGCPACKYASRMIMTRIGRRNVC